MCLLAQLASEWGKGSCSEGDSRFKSCLCSEQLCDFAQVTLAVCVLVPSSVQRRHPTTSGHPRRGGSEDGVSWYL